MSMQRTRYHIMHSFILFGYRLLYRPAAFAPKGAQHDHNRQPHYRLDLLHTMDDARQCRR